jgi:hypothetical protein
MAVSSAAIRHVVRAANAPTPNRPAPPNMPTVPKERVRLEKDTETGEKQVSEEVRKERIEAEGDIER